MVLICITYSYNNMTSEITHAEVNFTFFCFYSDDRKEVGIPYTYLYIY